MYVLRFRRSFLTRRVVSASAPVLVGPSAFRVATIVVIEIVVVVTRTVHVEAPVVVSLGHVVARVLIVRKSVSVFTGVVVCGSAVVVWVVHVVPVNVLGCLRGASGRVGRILVFQILCALCVFLRGSFRSLALRPVDCV